MVFHKPFSLVLPSKVLQVSGLNNLFILLLFILAMCSGPAAFANLPSDSDSSMTFLPFTHLLKKRSSNFLRDGFAVCELPFYEICDKNVSRIQCSALGCCFHKEVCYKKAVPSYMQVFIILILIIMAAFILFVCHSCVVKKNRSKRMHPPVDTSEPSVASSSESNEEDMSQE